MMKFSRKNHPLTSYHTGRQLFEYLKLPKVCSSILWLTNRDWEPSFYRRQKTFRWKISSVCGLITWLSSSSFHRGFVHAVAAERSTQRRALNEWKSCGLYCIAPKWRSVWTWWIVVGGDDQLNWPSQYANHSVNVKVFCLSCVWIIF